MNGIQAQQKELLAFVYRYFSVQLWALSQELRIKERDAERRAERLRKREMLQRLGTPYGAVYRLARKASPFLDLDENSRLVKKPSPTTIARDMAVLRYVLGGAEKQKRLTRDELEQAFCQYAIPDKLKNHPYSFDAEQKILACLRVPQGSDQAAGEELRADLFAFENTKPFPSLAAAGRFRFVVLAFEQQRAEAIRAQFSATTTIPVNFETVPYQMESAQA